MSSGSSGAPQASHLSLLSSGKNRLIFDFLLDNYNILQKEACYNVPILSGGEYVWNCGVCGEK